MQPDFDLRRCCDTLRCAYLFREVVELVDMYIDKQYISNPSPKNVSKAACYQEILSCFQLLVSQKDSFITTHGDSFRPIPPKQQLPWLKSTVLRALQIQDQEFLFSVYETLLKLDRLKIVFEMNPKHLELYLREQDGNQDLWKRKQRALLLYYDATKNLTGKVKFLYTMAFDLNPQYSLHERHGFLVTASCVTKILQSTSNNDDLRFLEYAQSIDKDLESSKIQLEMFKRLKERQGSSTAKPDDKVVLDMLNSKLLSINELEGVAAKSGLYINCLKIIKVLNQTAQATTVETAWEGIVREQLIQAEADGQRHQWLDYVARCVDEYAREFVSRPETMWLMPYEWFLIQVEHFDTMLFPEMTNVQCRIPALIERAGISRANILSAYCRKLPTIGEKGRVTQLRLLDVQLYYLDTIAKELRAKQPLDVDDRQVLIQAERLAQLLKRYLDKVILENREDLNNLQQEAQRLARQLKEMLRSTNNVPLRFDTQV